MLVSFAVFSQELEYLYTIMQMNTGQEVRIWNADGEVEREMYLCFKTSDVDWQKFWIA